MRQDLNEILDELEEKLKSKGIDFFDEDGILVRSYKFVIENRQFLVERTWCRDYIKVYRYRNVGDVVAKSWMHVRNAKKLWEELGI